MGKICLNRWSGYISIPTVNTSAQTEQRWVYRYLCIDKPLKGVLSAVYITQAAAAKTPKAPNVANQQAF